MELTKLADIIQGNIPTRIEVSSGQSIETITMQELNYIANVSDDLPLEKMLMYGKEASNRKQEIDRQHYTIPNQRPKDKHCGKI